MKYKQWTVNFIDDLPCQQHDALLSCLQIWYNQHDEAPWLPQQGYAFPLYLRAVETFWLMWEPLFSAIKSAHFRLKTSSECRAGLLEKYF
jgi:hypothetical protein